MKLYRIIHKLKGKSFGGWRYDGKQIWNDKGVFYRSLDTIGHHLKWIVSPKQYQGMNSRKTIEYKHATPPYSPVDFVDYDIEVLDVELKGGKKKIRADKLFA